MVKKKTKATKSEAKQAINDPKEADTETNRPFASPMTITTSPEAAKS